MNQELQSLLAMLYGNRQMGEKEIAAYTKQWDSNHNGFRDVLKNAALNKIKQDKDNQNYKPTTIDSSTIKTMQVKPTLMSVQHDAENIKPIEPKRAANDMSAVANFKEAFRQARQGGHKTFFWKKTKSNPSGMFSTELASKQPEAKQPEAGKPALQPKEKKSGESTPASKVQPQIKTNYAFDGRHIDLGKFPYAEPSDSNEPKNPDDYYPEFGRNAELYINPTELMPTLYPYEERILLGNNNVKTYKDGTPKINMNIPINTEVPEITGSNGTEFGKWYGSNIRKEQEKRDEYFRRKGLYKKGGTVSSGQTNGQVDAFMKSVLNGDPKTIEQLIQAADQGNAEATQLIQTILQEEQKGNTQVVKAASVIKQLLNQTISAKWGSKLNYIQKLKGICPEGTEKIYLKNGGCMCAQKAQKGSNGIEKNDTIHHNKQVYDLTGKHKQFKKLTNKDYRNLPTKKQASVDNKDMMRAKDAEKKSCGGKTKNK